MAEPRVDVERLNQALTQLAERAAADPSYREALLGDQVEQLRAAGVSALALSGAFAEEGAEEADVAGYGFTMAGGAGSGQIIVSNTCVGTCGTRTSWICCSKSMGGAAAAAAGGGGVGAF